MKVVLTIAGSDSSAGAGIQADLKTFGALGLHGVSAVTAVTAQSPAGIAAIHAVPPDVIAAQIETVVNDLPVAGVKTGMLGNRAAVDIISRTLRMRGLRPVVDPVLMSTSGTSLLARDALTRLTTRLLPQAAVVTPNAAEAGQLSGMTVGTLAAAREAACRIRDLGPAAVVITGGHLDPGDASVIDVVHDGDHLHEVVTPRVPLAPGTRTHGTGCTYSAALLARLVAGDAVTDAARAAQRYVAAALRRGDDGGLLYCKKWGCPRSS